MENQNFGEHNIFTRHSVKPKKDKPGGSESTEYPGISESGVELARERAGEILLMLESMKDGSVMFIGGSSELIRTKSTARVYGDEAKEIVSKEGKKNEIIVITEKDLVGEKKAINKILEIIDANKDKKILVDFPLHIKQFGMAPWLNSKGELSDYSKKLLERNNNNENACVVDWIENGGEVEGLKGPVPIEIAKHQIEGIKRLREFAERYVKDRPISIGVVAHSWNLDALAVYLANNGKVTKEGFEKLGGKMIGETQPGKIEIDETGKAKFMYGGVEYEVSE